MRCISDKLLRISTSNRYLHPLLFDELDVLNFYASPGPGYIKEMLGVLAQGAPKGCWCWLGVHQRDAGVGSGCTKGMLVVTCVCVLFVNKLIGRDV